MQDVYRIRYDGAIDADGHILEPPDLWERYLEPKYRDRALRIKVDDVGLEYLEIGGIASQLSRKGFPGTLGAMGKMAVDDVRPSPERTYLAGAPHGSMDMKERLERLDAENLDAAVLYPTIGILWEAELPDAELSTAYTRAYNRWIADFCRDSRGRLVPIAHVSLGDPAAAAKELERAVHDGCRGAFVVPFTWSRLPHGHETHDPLFAAAQDLDVPIAIHPAFEPPAIAGSRYTLMRKARLLSSVTAADGVRHAFTTLFDFGTFDRFPRLKIVVLESGAGWIGYWLDRIDAVYEATFIGERVPLAEKPSHYFRTRCWISADPDERMIPALVDRFGAERFFWASDFPHADHTADYAREVEELAGLLVEPARKRFLGENAKELYKITVRVAESPRK
jgi:predicted TIM-barrel fold metal-dependent hydrolase